MERGYSYDSIPHLLKKYGPRSVDLVFMDQKAWFWNTFTIIHLIYPNCNAQDRYISSLQIFRAKPPFFPSAIDGGTLWSPAGNPLSQRSGFNGGAESAVRPGSDSGRQRAEARCSALHLALGQGKLLGDLSFFLSIYLSFFFPSFTIYIYNIHIHVIWMI